MKWYHFSLIFLVLFGSFFVIEQKDELWLRLQEGSQRVEYDCLVAAVNAATENFFSMEGGLEKEILLKNTETAFFQTLSVLHERNADETGIGAMRKRTPLLAVFGEDAFFVYQRTDGEGYGWTDYAYEADGKIPEFIFTLVTAAMEEYLEQLGGVRQEAEASGFFAGIWEKELSKGCVFAVYAPKLAQLSGEERAVFLYAAAKKVVEKYLVTEDMRCHLPSCALAREGVVTGVFGTQKEAAKYGAAPCTACLLWETEN